MCRFASRCSKNKAVKQFSSNRGQFSACQWFVFYCLVSGEVYASRLPLLGGLHVEGALDDSGPLQAADDECVGLGPFRLHQLALWPQTGREGAGEEGRCGGEQRRDRPTVIAIYLYRHPNTHCRSIWRRTGALWWRETTSILNLSAPLKQNVCQYGWA